MTDDSLPPTAVGYVSARTPADQARQRAALTGYAKAAGLRMGQTVVDARDGMTITELVDVAEEFKATRLLIPASAHLAKASARVSAELAGKDAQCVVVDDGALTDRAADDGRSAARLSATLRRLETAPVPA